MLFARAKVRNFNFRVYKPADKNRIWDNLSRGGRPELALRLVSVETPAMSVFVIKI